MSLTTSAGTRLTRRQTSQMPALLEFYSPSAELLETREKGPARGVIWSVAKPVRGLHPRGRADPHRHGGDRPGQGDGDVRHHRGPAAGDVESFARSTCRRVRWCIRAICWPGSIRRFRGPTRRPRHCNSPACGPRSSGAGRKRAGVDYRPTIDDQAAQVQEAIFAQRRAERTFRLQKYQENIDGLRATLAKAMGDIQAYTDRMSVATTVEGKRRELEKLGWAQPA